jgi:gas vesicle protein
LTGARGNTSSLDNALRRSSRSSEAITIQRKKPDWLIQKEALNKKFTRVDEKTGTAIKEPWSPRKKISPEAMQGIRTLHAEHPDYDLPKLASIFKISPEAVRRILRSKWQPTPEEAAAQAERWKKRKQSVWQRWADQGRIQLSQKNMKERVQPAQRTAPLVVEKRLSVKSGFL